MLKAQIDKLFCLLVRGVTILSMLGSCNCMKINNPQKKSFFLYLMNLLDFVNCHFVRLQVWWWKPRHFKQIVNVRLSVDNGAIVCFPHHGDTSMVPCSVSNRRKRFIDLVFRSIYIALRSKNGSSKILVTPQRNAECAWLSKLSSAMASFIYWLDTKMVLWLSGRAQIANGSWKNTINLVRYELRFDTQISSSNNGTTVLDLAVHDTIGISTSADNQIVKYNLFESSPSIQNASIKKHGLAAVDIRSDGKILATGGHDGRLVHGGLATMWAFADSNFFVRIRVFSLKTLKPLAIMNYHRDSAYAVAFGPVKENAEHWLLGGSKDGRISLWNIY